MPSEFSKPEAAALAGNKHALNVSVCEFDFQRARELAALEGYNGVSEIVRLALAKALDEHPQADKIGESAVANIEFAARRTAQMQEG